MGLGTKESNKIGRKYAKAVRHKLLFHIPLTDEEERFVKMTKLTEHSQITRIGNVRWSEGSDRWRFLNPKEMNEKEEK